MKHILILTLVALGSFTTQLVAFEPTLNLYDEGNILVGAERVLHGEVPYRDFWTIYGPAQFYVIAGLFSLFGESDLSLRLLGMITKAAIATLSYSLIAHYSSKLIALVSAVLVTFLLISVRSDGFPVLPALAFSMLALILYDAGVSQSSWWRFILSGISTGIAGIYRHDLGTYLGVTVFLSGIAIPWALSVRQSNVTSNSRGNAFGQYLVGTALVVAPVALAITNVVPWADLRYCLIDVPAKIYPAVRSLPFPSLPEFNQISEYKVGHYFEVAVYVPFIVILYLIEKLLVKQFNKSKEQRMTFVPKWNLFFAIAILNTLFIFKGIVRVETVHMIQSIVLSIILLMCTAEQRSRHVSAQTWLYRFVLIMSISLLLAPAAVGMHLFVNGMNNMFAKDTKIASLCQHPELPRLRCVSLDPDYLEAARYIRLNSNQSDGIYVGTGRHDRIFINASMLYFSAERRSVTSWHELHPGVVTQIDIQEKMVSQMQRTPPRFVVLDTQWDSYDEPNSAKVSSGVHKLDNFISENYRLIRSFGTVQILEPK